jgi:hypothetical protein
MVRAAADTASSEPDFLQRLRAAGLLVRLRAAAGPNEHAGYAVALPGDHTAARHPVWYSGSTLAADLSLPGLRRRWPAP